jgi:hypothetical protein
VSISWPAIAYGSRNASSSPTNASGLGELHNQEGRWQCKICPSCVNLPACDLAFSFTCMIHLLQVSGTCKIVAHLTYSTQDDGWMNSGNELAIDILMEQSILAPAL